MVFFFSMTDYYLVIDRIQKFVCYELPCQNDNISYTLSAELIYVNVKQKKKKKKDKRKNLIRI